MKTLMITAAALALAGPAFAQTAAPMTEDTTAVQTMPADGATAETMPADGMATSMAMSADNPGISASWFEDRPIYTTNQPSTTAWDNDADWGTERPDDWNQIGEVDDVVLSADGQVMGYTADIGGFLGIGEHTVLLSPEAVRLVDFDEATLWGESSVFTTNYTQEELEALPEFDDDMILDD
ncbi:PRC-barrel domain-containing protein [Paracoccus beibuensis]|uniref:PRC-barrel domain-containing protein n=1 Tax=Paracoccus beibuensis TaxID=547602 RepID=UPI00223F8A52|nr:PRC-barrel domain-containing protein [Paracoccus beibuensis]